MTHAHSRGPEVTWTGSHVDRKSCGAEVTWSGSHAVDRKSRGGPEVTRRTGCHVDRKSRGPEVTCTGSHVDRKSRGPEVTCPSLGDPSQGSGKKHCALRLPSLGDQARSPRSGNTIEPIGL